MSFKDLSRNTYLWNCNIFEYNIHQSHFCLILSSTFGLFKSMEFDLIASNFFKFIYHHNFWMKFNNSSYIEWECCKINLLLKSLLVRARNNFDAEFASADSTNTKCEYPLVRVISVIEFLADLHDQLRKCRIFEWIDCQVRKFLHPQDWNPL